MSWVLVDAHNVQCTRALIGTALRREYVDGKDAGKTLADNSST